MTRLLAGLVFVSYVAAQTWQCWSTSTSGPQFAPASVSAACAGVTTGSTWTQTATYQVQPNDLQTQTLSPAVTIKATGAGICTDIFSPYDSQAPVFSIPTTSYVGSNLEWSVLSQGWAPSYFTVAGAGTVVWGGSLQAGVATTHDWTETPCTCHPTDCSNPTAKSQCGQVCTCPSPQPPAPSCRNPPGNPVWTPAPTCAWACIPISPIIFDIDGLGYDLTNARNGVVFDWGGDRLLTSWTAAHSTNAFLALLPNGAEAITNAAQLFGNLTPQPPCAPDTCNGFLALAQYDSNHDGVIDSRDAIWPSLLLWFDRNHDGISQPEELVPIAAWNEQNPALAITAISLSYQPSGITGVAGNQFRFCAPVAGPGAGRFACDVYFVPALP
jgi:hypothetical protein